MESGARPDRQEFDEFRDSGEKSEGYPDDLCLVPGEPSRTEKINWYGWKTEKVLGKGTYGTVYRISRTELGQKQESVLKVVRIPGSEAELGQMHREGLSEEEIHQTLLQRVRKASQELTVLCSLKGSRFIVNYEDHAVFRDKNTYIICLQMELLTALPDFLKNHRIELDDLFRLGIHICKALEICERKNIIHRDIKPENIFVTSDGDFRLGDFGIAAVSGKTERVLAGTEKYLAPEIAENGSYSFRSDQYALGITLKEVLNRLEKSEQGGNRKSLKKEEPDRWKELKKILEKATAPEPELRYGNSAEMCRQLEAAEQLENRILNGKYRRLKLVLLTVSAGLAVSISYGQIVEQQEVETEKITPVSASEYPETAGSGERSEEKEKKETDEVQKTNIQNREGTENQKEEESEKGEQKLRSDQKNEKERQKEKKTEAVQKEEKEKSAEKKKTSTDKPTTKKNQKNSRKESSNRNKKKVKEKNAGKTAEKAGKTNLKNDTKKGDSNRKTSGKTFSATAGNDSGKSSAQNKKSGTKTNHKSTGSSLKTKKTQTSGKTAYSKASEKSKTGSRSAGNKNTDRNAEEDLSGWTPVN